MSDPELAEFEASDGYRFRYRRYPPTTDPRGYVVALHGIQSHSGWYEASSRRLADAGFEVRFLDRRGSGLNQQDRGHAPHADRLIGDVVQMLAEVRIVRDRDRPQAPILLLGVSWGGKLAAVTCARRPKLVDGLSLLYPGIRARIRPRWHQKRLLALADALGQQRRQAPIPLDDPALFTSELHWQRMIANDPLVLRTATVDFYRASLALDREVESAPPHITCPMLLMLAGQDRIINNAATRRWFSRVNASRRTLIEYARAAHTLEFEPNRDQIFDDLIAWASSVRNLRW